jgi:tetratricopeptide (TPR) repeat protein
LATTYNNIGGVYWLKGDPDEALKWYDKALKIREQGLNSLSPDLAKLYGDIGLAYHSKGDYDEALNWLYKALKIEEQVLNPLSPSLATTYSNIGMVCLQANKLDKALEYFEKALTGYIKRYGEEHKNTNILKQWIEKCKQALGE